MHSFKQILLAVDNELTNRQDSVPDWLQKQEWLIHILTITLGSALLFLSRILLVFCFHIVNCTFWLINQSVTSKYTSLVPFSQIIQFYLLSFESWMQKWIVLFKLFLLNTDSFSFVCILDILKLWLAGCLFQYFYFIFLQCTISYKQTILVKTCLCLDLAGAKVSGCNVFKVMSYLDLNNYFTNKLLSDFRVYPHCQFLIKYCISVKMADLFSGLLPRGDEQSPELSMTDSNGEGHLQNSFPFIIFFQF